jgi:hypothetical protein
MSDGLPKHLRILRDRLRTALNALDTYERLEIASAWGADASDRKREIALQRIESAVISAADAIGCHPSEKQFLHDIITKHRAELARYTKETVR